MRKGTAVIYARFSCSKQREASIEDQLRVCSEWCGSNGYDVVATYCDYAQSGRSDNRPEFQRMMSNAGEAELVVVYMMDRFSRGEYDAPIYKKKLKDKGCRVVSATETLPDGPEAILIEKIYEGLAAVESAHISKRVRRGMEGNARKCLHNGSVLFGYSFAKDGTYEVNEKEAEVVREVFARRIEGEAFGSIADDLAMRGYVTTHGNPANYNMVRSMLSNEKYKGTYVWGDVRVEGGMPRIVDDATFDAAQNVRSSKVRAQENWGDYAFAGRGVCMECGMNLVGVSGKGSNGTRYDYYRCSKKCGCKPIRRDMLENAVVDGLREMLGDRDTALAIANAVSKIASTDRLEERLNEANKNAANATRAINNLMKAVEDGMPYADVAERLAELRERRDRAQAEMEMLKTQVDIDPEDFADFLMLGATLTDKDLLDAFVWQVQLGKERVIVVLNYDVNGEPARLIYRRGFAENEFGRPNPHLCELGIIEGRVAVSIVRPQNRRRRGDDGRFDFAVAS